MMSEDENPLFAKCLDFTRSLVENNQEFSFKVSTRCGYVFSFTNQESGKPESWKKKKTPSQIKRNQLRMEKFREKQAREASGKPDAAAAEYELKVQAHATCTTEDVIEAIETNFFGTLNDLDKAKSGVYEDLKDMKVNKLEQKQVIRKIDGEFRNLQVYKVAIKDNDVARKVIESWNGGQVFDDYAFRKSDCKEIRIKIKEVDIIR